MIKPFQTEYVPKTTSRLDGVYDVTAQEVAYLINVEPMGYYDRKLPARMMRYYFEVQKHIKLR